ncbi:MAG: ribonuclease J [Actinomycetota bacterium]
MRIIFLGGAGEVGRNMTVFEHDGKILIVDAGLMFPGDEMLGVDLVLPDFEYLRGKADSVVGVMLSHGHEDHIGAVPYLLKEINVPVYGGEITLGLLERKLEEHRILDSTDLRPVKAPCSIDIGPFHLDLYPVVHSIPDAVATVISTSAGRILYTGDFKLDPDPVDGPPTDLEGLGKAAEKGIDVMLADSTNSDEPGKTPPERIVRDALAAVIRDAPGRVIIACFASHLQRIQQIILAAESCGRMVCLLGRSMSGNSEVARRLGHLQVRDEMLVSPDEADLLPENRLVIVSTGAQGEPLSALSLMAARDHRTIDLHSGDTVVLAATPIPGNESAVNRVIDGLYRIGCRVITPPQHNVHVSGHASADDLELMIKTISPRWFVPVHGEYRMLAGNAALARKVGVPGDRILICEDGDVLELQDGRLSKVDRIEAGYVLVDGFGIGDVHDEVLRDRRILADDGVVVCVVTIDAQTGELLAGPDLISRGFVIEDEAEDFLEEARAEIRQSLASLAEDEITDWTAVRRAVRRSLGKLVAKRTGRRPMLLPVVMEV